MLIIKWYTDFFFTNRALRNGHILRHSASKTEIDIADISQWSPPKLSAYVWTERWTLKLWLRNIKKQSNTKTAKPNERIDGRSEDQMEATTRQENPTCTCFNLGVQRRN
jgi:hypothetical protein